MMPPARHGGWASAALPRLLDSASGDAGGLGGPGAAKGEAASADDCHYDHRALLGVALSYANPRRAMDLWKVCRGTGFLQASPGPAGIVGYGPQIQFAGVPIASASHRLLIDHKLKNYPELHWAFSPENTHQAELGYAVQNSSKAICGQTVADKSDGSGNGDDGVTVLGVMSWFNRRYSQPVATKVSEDEGWSFMRERYYDPVWKSVDSSLRGMGLYPQGPFSRLFVLLLAYSAASKAFMDAASGISWIKDNVRCHSSKNMDELKQCLGCFGHNFFRAHMEDACGWGPIVFDRD